MANEIEFEIVARLDKVEGALKGLEKTAEKTGEKITGSIINARLIEGAAKTAFKAFTDSISTSVKAAQEQESAMNRMNNAMAMAGRYSQAASEDFVKFASSIQATSTIGDETAMSYLALASNFARTNEEAKKLTQAAIDLSAATGKGVEESLRALGGSLQGVSGGLGRVLPQMRGLTEEQLKAGAAVDYVAQRFAGAASSELNTFSGAVKQLENAWSDLDEETGNLIIKSPALVAAIKYITEWVTGMVASFAEASKSGGDVLRPFLTTAIQVGQFLTAVFGPIIDYTINLFKKLGEGIGAVASSLVNLASGNFQAAFDDLKSGLVAGVEATLPVMETKGTETGMAFFNGLEDAVNNAAPVVGSNISNRVKEAVSEVPLTIGTLFNSINNQIQNSATRTQVTIANLATTMKSNLGGGIANAFAALGGALVKGENAFAAFGKAMLATFGQIAVQIGTVLIAAGLGWSFIPGFQASAAAIPQGIALTVIGGALMALGGGGGGASTPSTSASASGQSSPVGTSTTSLQQPQERQVGTSVAVNIAGSVLGDKRTLGREIADALNEAFGTDGITIARGATV